MDPGKTSKAPVRGRFAPPRTIRQLMTVVALSGLAMSALSRRDGVVAPRPTFRAARPTLRVALRALRHQPPVVQPAEPGTVDDRILVAAPQGIDARFVVAAPDGIDDGIFAAPARSPRLLVVPPGR